MSKILPSDVAFATLGAFVSLQRASHLSDNRCMGLLRVALRRSRVSYEGVELGGHYPEPWLIKGSPFREFCWRLFLGRPMDNEIRTNATFWRSATTGYPSWWLRLAGWQRLALRLAGAWSVLVVLPLLTLTLTAVL